MRAIIPILCSIVLLVSGHASAACVDWPRIMADEAKERLPAGKKVLVQALIDDTKRAGDEWLAAGIRDYLADLLATGGLQVQAGLTASGASPADVDMVVDGSFQHTDSRLRVFLAARDGKTGELLKQLAVDFPYPNHIDFFKRIADAAIQLIKLAGAVYDPSAIAARRDATASTACYENFSRGQQALQRFTEKDAKLSLTWFREAKRADYTSTLGYQGIVDAAVFLGLLLKQERKPFSHYFQQAEVELAEMMRLARRQESPSSKKGKPQPLKKTAAPVPLEHPWLRGHAYFLEGLHAAQQKKWDKAEEALERAVKEVPADAIAWHHLSQVLKERGKRAASLQAGRRAASLNSCLDAGGQNE